MSMALVEDFGKSIANTLELLIIVLHNTDSLAQDCTNSIANMLELPQSCSNPHGYIVYPCHISPHYICINPL